MFKTVDCFFIGHNDVNFSEYVESVKKMGVHSGAYRDLNLGFLQYRDEPYHAASMFNRLFCGPGMGGLPIGAPFQPISEGETFSGAVAYLGTYLSRRGCTFDYVNTFQDEKEELARKLQEENIRTIAVTTTFYVSPLPILEIMSFIRQHNKTAKVIIGGPFIATQARVMEPAILDFLFNSIGADFYVVSSRGEAALVNIIDALKKDSPLDTVNNIYYKSGNRYKASAAAGEDNRLSDNMVDWSLFAGRVGEYVVGRTSISCPFSCAFCGFPEHAGQYQEAEMEAIEVEFDTLVKIESVKNTNIIDDTLNIPKKRFRELLRMFIKNKYPEKFSWLSNYRCQYADRETVALMKESGCEGVFLGIESGNNQVLRNMNKQAAADKFLEGIALLKEYGIITFGSFIIGFPGETDETVRDTVRLIEESKPDFYRAQLWYCEPITPIWRQREKYGITGSHFEWSHDTMNSKEAGEHIENMFLTVKNSVWLPQHGFNFPNIFHLTNREIPSEQVKKFLSGFNEGVKEKVLDPARSEVSPDAIRKMQEAIALETEAVAASGEVQERNIEFDFNLD